MVLEQDLYFYHALVITAENARVKLVLRGSGHKLRAEEIPQSKVSNMVYDRVVLPKRQETLAQI